MRFGILLCGLAAASTFGFSGVAFAQTAGACAVTEAPNPPFVPPPGWDAINGASPYFLYGTPGLWADVHNHWRLHVDGRKLPYFSRHYEFKVGSSPRMAVVARRLDGPAPLVWSDNVLGAGPPQRPGEPVDPAKRGFMVTRLEIPTAGCWEITARYFTDWERNETLSYTVLVEP